MKQTRHSLLERQLRRIFVAGVPRTAEFVAFVTLVDQAYHHADEDRRLTERSLELASEELLDRTRKLRAFFDSAPFMMGIASVVDGDVVLASSNRAAREAFGLEGRGPTAMRTAGVPPPIAQLWLEQCREARVAWPRPARFDYRTGDDGSVRHFSATLSALDGRIEGDAYCFVVEDVTETRALVEQLAQRDRLAVVGTLAAGVAHEINNPLSYVLTNLSLAIEDLSVLGASADGQWPVGPVDVTLAPVLETLRDAAVGADRVRAIVRDLKTFSRPSHETPSGSTVDLARVLEFATKMASVDVRRRARLEVRVGALPHVRGDETRLGQVFLNLLVNAAESIPPGRPSENLVSVVAEVGSDGRPYVDVSDTGAGIAEAAVTRIFDPFFTTKSSAGGTGLGLSLSNAIVRSLGGTVTVLRTALGRGTTLRVTLVPAEAGQPIARRVTTAPPVRRGRVLVVDDDALVRAATERALSRDHDVVAAVGGPAAIELLARDSAFDVIFCDLRMPHADGQAVYTAAIARRPGLADRFVVVTGDPDEHSLADLRERGVRVVEKPFDPSALRAIVREILARPGARAGAESPG